MKKRIKKDLTCLILIGLMASLFACDRNETIRIGFVGGLSGRVADLGVGGRNGVMLAVEEQNARGGIHGKPIELIVKDDQQDVDAAKQVIKALLDQKVEIVLGPMTSSMAMAMVPLVNASDIILLSPTVTTTELVDRDDHFMRVISTTMDYAAKSARYQFETSGRRNVAVIYDLDNKSYTQSWLNDFKTVFEGLGGRVLLVKSFLSGDEIVFYDRVKELLAVNPDLFLIISNAVDAALICQQVRKINDTIPIVMSEWASTERFVELGGSASEGVFVAQFIDRKDSSDRYKKFRRGYLERFGQEPGFAGLAGYDTALVAIEAFSAKKKGESLKEAIIRKKVFRCTQQTIAINPFGEANRNTFITRIHDGKYITIE